MLKILKGKLSKTAERINRKVALIISVAFIVVTCCGFVYATPNVVTISVSDSSPVQIETTDTNVAKILSKQGIMLNEGDRINYELTDQVENNAVISIVRAANVNIVYMGENIEFSTCETAVSKVLLDAGIVVDGDDLVTPALYEKVYEGDTITVVKNDLHTVTVQEAVAHTVTEIENANLAPGERVVIQEGKDGVNEYVYEINYHDGAEVSRQMLRSAVLSNPVEEIIEYAPQEEWSLGAIPASRPTKYSRVEVYNATAYDASPADNGIWAGKTSTGMPLVYGVVAVDPRVIPYGTKMYIESVDGQFIYGYAIAGDCGGAIKGKKVDLFFPSRSTCYQFGRRPVRIYFLD